MLITNLDRFRDGGTIAIYCDNEMTPRYHCNPGVFGTKAKFGKFESGSGYNPPAIPNEELQAVNVALKLFRAPNHNLQRMVNDCLGVLHEVYGLPI